MILDKIVENFGFSQNLKKVALVKIYKNLEFGRNFPKNLDFGQNCRKFSILVKTFQNVDFVQNCRECWL